MTSGEGGVGRTCIRPGEVGNGTPCQDGTVITSTVTPRPTKLPQTGAGSEVIVIYTLVIVVVLIALARLRK